MNKWIRNLLLVFSILVIIIIVILICWTRDWTIGNKYYNKSRKCFDNAEYNQALKNSKKAAFVFFIARNKKEFLSSKNLQAEIYIKKYELQPAIKILDKINSKIIIEPDRYDTLLCTVTDNKSEIYYLLGDYSKSLQLYNENLNRKITLFGYKSIEVFNSFNNIGNVYSQNREYNNALKYYTKAILLSEELENKDNYLAEVYNNIGNLFNTQGKYTDARNYFNQSLKLLKDHLNQDFKLALINNNIGNNYKLIGDYKNALKYYYKSLRILNLNTKDIYFKLKVYNNIANVLNAQGYYQQAKIYYHKTIQDYKKNINFVHPDLADIYNNLGNTYFNNGEYNIAIENYNYALLILKKTQPQENIQVFKIYQNLGISLLSIDDIKDAKNYFEKSIDLIKVKYGKNHEETGRAFQNLSNALLQEKLYNDALEYSFLAMDIYKKLPENNLLNLYSIYNQISDIYFEISNFDKAIEYLYKALFISNIKKDEKNPFSARLYNKFAKLNFATGNTGKSLKNYQKAIFYNTMHFNDSTNSNKNPVIKSFFKTSNFDYLDQEVLVESLYGKAFCLKSLYEEEKNSEFLFKANTIILKLDTLIENIRYSFKKPEDQLVANQRFELIYNLAIDICLKLSKINLTNAENWKEKAYYFVQKSKTNILYSLIKDTKAKNILPDSLINKEFELKNIITDFTIQLNQQKLLKKKQNEEKINMLEKELFELNNTYRDLIFSYESNYPEYFKLKYDFNFASISDIKNSLIDDEVILEYFIGIDSLYIFNISVNNYDIAVTPIDSLYDNFQIYQVAIKTQEYSNYLRYAQRLYNQLIKPIEENILNCKKLVILPHNYLFYLPFEALISKQSNSHELDFTSFNYLIKDYEIVYHYNGKLYYQYKNKSADIVNIKNIIAYSPVTDKTVTVDDMQFKPLKYSGEEVNKISKLFSKSDYKVKTLLGKDATKNKFINTSDDYDVIHIATHGLAYDETPSLSFLIFNNKKHEESLDMSENVLRLDEIFELNLKADLVVLSACETGAGKLINGEGVIAMTRGFLYAGANNVVHTIWSIDDKTTMDFMEQFYLGIYNKHSYSISLRDAKLYLIKNPNTSFPSFWSSYVLLGI